MPTVAEFLKQVPLFAGLADEQRECIARACTRETYRANSRLFREGDAGSILYVVAQGGVKVYQVDPDLGQETTLALLTSGDYVGELSLLIGSRRTASAVTIADGTELIQLERAELYACLRGAFEMGCAILSGLAMRMQQLNSRLCALALDSAASRIAKLLLLRSEPGTGRIAPISQEEIAAIVGVRRETVARNLARMEANTILRRNRGNVIIQDRVKLEQLSRMQTDGLAQYPL
jgi:CRP-like cAMP-binding protein